MHGGEWVVSMSRFVMMITLMNQDACVSLMLRCSVVCTVWLSAASLPSCWSVNALDLYTQVWQITVFIVCIYSAFEHRLNCRGVGKVELPAILPTPYSWLLCWAIGFGNLESSKVPSYAGCDKNIVVTRCILWASKHIKMDFGRWDSIQYSFIRPVWW